MAINDKLIVQEAAAAGGDSNPNILLDLNASDVDSYDGTGDVWYDIHDFEFKPTTNVAENFNTVLYDGDSGDQPITGVGFSPDLVWIKNRTTGFSHSLQDTIRGAGQYKMIYSDLNSSQATYPNYGYLSAFGDDGFTVSGSFGSFGFAQTNASPDKYVAWCFKAGGAPSGSDKISIDGTSYANKAAAGLVGTHNINKLSANTDLGFSIIDYDGNNTTGTIPHGLGVPAEMIITKSKNNTANWFSWHKGLTSIDHYVSLNSTAGQVPFTTNDGIFGGALPNSNVFSVGSDFSSNGTNNQLIAYCFASKRGVSKVGSYRGTGVAENKVYTGFEPAFVMFKNTTTTGSWIMHDNKREVTNPRVAHLRANTPGAEDTGSSEQVDFNRDGFTLKGTGQNANSSGHKFIYYAVAKNTNETSLIAPGTNLKLGLDAGTYSGSGNWLDSSGNSNDGVITGATWEQELGNFFELNGSTGSIDIPNNLGIWSNNWTSECWVYFNTTSPSNQSVFTSHGELYNYLITNNNTQLRYNNGNGVNFSTSSGSITSNKWTHIVITRSSSTGTVIYIDGEVSATNSSTSNAGSSGGSGAKSQFGMYRSTATNNYPLNGKFGQIRLYSTPLTEAQVRQNYNFTKPRYPNEFHGAITGASYNTAGYFDFDSSSDYVTVPATSTTPIDVRQSFSVATWVKFNVINVTHNFIENYSNGGTISFTLGVLSDGTINVTLRSGSTNNNTSTAAGVVTTGSFRHIAVTRTAGTDVKIYLDKVLVKTAAYTSTPNISSSNVFTIGGKQWAFDGEISKVKMYNAALSETEIEALYNEGE